MKLHSSVAISAVAVAIAAPGAAEAKAHHHHKVCHTDSQHVKWCPVTHHHRHHRHGGAESGNTEQLTLAQQQISQLQAQLNALQTKVDQGAAPAPAASSQSDALAQAASAKADQAIAVAEAAKAEAARPAAIPAPLAWASNTQIGGKLYLNASTITVKSNGVKGPSNSSSGAVGSGTGVNVKRVYLTFDHQFSKVFSASVVTDVSNVIGETTNGNYVTPSSTPTCTSSTVKTLNTTPTITCTAAPLAGTAEDGKGLYLKNAYGQAKISPAFVVRIGEFPTAWVPYEESIYGYRHVEDVFADRIGVAKAADWGVAVLGDLAGGLISYQIDVVDGAGYRNVKVTNAVDIEGRLSAQYKGFYGAVAGYSGYLGNDIQQDAAVTTPATENTAKRVDFALGYKNKMVNLGAEYVYAKDFSHVAYAATYDQDSTLGFSVFGNVNLTPKWSVFGRYDFARTLPSFSKYNNYEAGLANSYNNRISDHYLNAGIQWEPAKTVDIALVYKRQVANNGPFSDAIVGTIPGVVATSTTPGESGTFSEVGVYTQLKF